MTVTLATDGQTHKLTTVITPAAHVCRVLKMAHTLRPSLGLDTTETMNALFQAGGLVLNCEESFGERKCQCRFV